MNRSLPERNSQHMNAALAAASAATDAITLPLVLTVSFATGRLTGMTAAASGACAGGILVSAVLMSVAFGGATATAANDAPATSVVAVVPAATFDAPTTGDLSGPQLPTE
jgi:hypothetical protein